MSGIDPMTPFTHWNWEAPYEVGEGYYFPAKVTPVTSKSGLGIARGGGVHRTHLIRRAASLLEPQGWLRYAAKWMCSANQDGASNIALLSADAVDSQEICAQCGIARIGPCVYRCFDAAGRLLYIGSTERLDQRRASHSQRTPWWAEVAEVKADPYPVLADARRAEWAAIRAEAPPRNKAGVRRGAEVPVTT